MRFENQAQLEQKLKQAFDNPPEGFTLAKQQNIMLAIRQSKRSKRLNRRVVRWSLGSVMVCVLLLGCYLGWSAQSQPRGVKWQPAPAVQDPNQTLQPQKETKVNMPDVKPRADWEIIGKSYLIQGTVAKIYQQSNTWVAIEIHVEKMIPGPTTSVGDPNYPFPGGTLQTIAINQTIDSLKNQLPTEGASILINCTQYASKQNNAFTFWGSSIPSIYIKQGNEYISPNGVKFTN